ncbi:MAG TPA: ATP-binding protein [Verrucomicrobiota bacterium]|nr:ATP-binding protein [Verrucomicrobiota bacterium]
MPASNRVQFGKPAASIGHRVLVYGPGGIGKTTLASQAPGPVAFIDSDESLPRLRIDTQVVMVNDWQGLRAALQADGWDGIKTIVLDSITRIEEWCVAHTLATVPHEKGHRVSRVEDYGYGKGYQYVFDTFLPLLSDLDRHCRAGRNVILIAHDCCTNVPNPAGEDWLRYEPRLQSPTSGKASVRLRVREWADHVLFLGYDVIAKDGKGRGSGTRTLWPAELPHCMAKSRTTQTPIAVDGSTDVWAEILK